MVIKRKRSLSSYFLLLLTGSILSCTSTVEEDVDFKNDFRDQVLRVIEEQNDSTINMKNVSSVDWDEMYVFKPYTPIDTIYASLGYNWEGATSTLINQSDHFNLVVFVKDQKVTSFSKVPRDFGDFLKVDEKGPFSKNDAEFKVKKEAFGGQDWIFLYNTN